MKLSTKCEVGFAVGLVGILGVIGYNLVHESPEEKATLARAVASATGQIKADGFTPTNTLDMATNDKKVAFNEVVGPCGEVALTGHMVRQNGTIVDANNYEFSWNGVHFTVQNNAELFSPDVLGATPCHDLAFGNK